MKVEASKTAPGQVSEPVAADPHAWNTKNLGLRLLSDGVSAVTAAALVSPVITIIDKQVDTLLVALALALALALQLIPFLSRAIMQNASGQAPLRQSLRTSIFTLLTPQTLLLSKPFALICLLYGGTYLSANCTDTLTCTVDNKPASSVTSGTTKFLGTTSANISLCLFKDQSFARMFGPSNIPPRPVPLPTYVLFTVRDCMTIFASFNIPPLLGPIVQESLSKEMQKSISGQTVAQYVAPAAIQLFSTPLHLLGLDLYNRGKDSGVTWGDRFKIVRKNWGVSAAARMCRIIPAFGVGGVVNTKVRKALMEKLE